MKDPWISAEFLVAIGLFALYIAGYLIVNMHLVGYNLTEATWLSFNYIKAGISFLGFTLPSVFLAYLTSRGEKNEEPVSAFIRDFVFAVIGSLGYGYVAFAVTGSFSPAAESLSTTPARIVTVAIAFIVASCCLFAALKLSTGTRNKRIRYGLSWLLVIGAVGIAWVGIYGKDLLILYFLFTGLGCQVLARYTRRCKENSIPQQTLWIPVAGITLFLITCLLYGALLYGWIPLQLGGGRPFFTRFYLHAEALNKLVQSGAISSPAVLQTPVEVVYVSEKAYYVLVDGNAVALPTENITGYAGLDPRTP